jgi:phosphoribosyl 1,2-cyclic phosphate phosphodiesterase
LAAIRHGLARVDAVLFTHSHADHIFGLDDLRTFNWLQRSEIPLYAEPPVLDDIRRAFNYIWRETQEGGGKPKLTLNAIEAGTPVNLGGAVVEPLRVFHGTLPILGFRIGGKVSYLTDVSEIPPETWARIENCDLLFLDAVRHKPHPTHFHLERAIEVAAALAARQTYFVHLSHDYDHAETDASLPERVRLAYDGLTHTF